MELGQQGKMGIGLQLYTLRGAPDDLPTKLRKVAELGYEGVEFAGFDGLPANEVNSLLAELHWNASAVTWNSPNWQQNLDEVIAFHRAIGASYIVCPWLNEEQRNIRAASMQTAATLRDWGQTIAAAGLRFGYHNHWFEFEQSFDDERLFNLLVKDAADTVKVELDVCWVQHAGQDPLAYLTAYAAQTPLIHLKDMTVDDEGTTTTVPLGTGIMDLDSVLKVAEDTGVEWLIVEQDECQGDPYANAAHSRNGCLNTMTVSSADSEEEDRMKLGVFAVLFQNKSFEEALDLIAQSSLDAIEIGCGRYPGKAYCRPSELLQDKERLRTFRSAVPTVDWKSAPYPATATRYTLTQR